MKEAKIEKRPENRKLKSKDNEIMIFIAKLISHQSNQTFNPKYQSPTL